MGSYGIGLTRVVATIVEQHHDERGLVWPASVAPAHVHLVPLRDVDAALEIAAGLDEAGVRVLVDDRPGLSAGVRLTDVAPRVGLLVLHRQGDALAIVFELDDLDADLLSELDDFLGIGDAAAAHLRNVKQTVDSAEVDEGAERGEGLHRAGQLRAGDDRLTRLHGTRRGLLLEERRA